MYVLTGYLTNTGIKFMILVENIYLNGDGTRFRQDHAPPSLSSTMFGKSTMSTASSFGGNREADLKNMFVSYLFFTILSFCRVIIYDTNLILSLRQMTVSIIFFWI